MSELGSNLRAARLAAGLSLSAMARHTHYSKPYLGLIETGKRAASPDIVRAYETVLGTEGLEMDRRSFLAAVALAPLGVDLAANDPETLERVSLAVRSPHRTDQATIAAIADALSCNRRLEDAAGVAVVFPSVRRQLTLVDHLLSGCRGQVRDRVAAVTGEMHQYTGWLCKASGDSSGAYRQLDAALALGVEIDDPDLVSMALSFKGTTALDDGDAGAAVALSRAAARDKRVFIAQQAYNAFQEARGHGLAGDGKAVERAVNHGEELVQSAVEQQHNAPPGQYWYGPGFFTVQRGLAWHALRDQRHAQRAADDITQGIADLPDDEKDSEWAARFNLSAAEAHADAGDFDRAAAAALCVLHVARSAGSRPLETSVRRLRDEWAGRHPTASVVRALDDTLGSSPHENGPSLRAATPADASQG